MEYRLLGGSGLKVPVLSFGTATFGARAAHSSAHGAAAMSMTRRGWLISALTLALTYLTRRTPIRAAYLKKSSAKPSPASEIGF